MARSPRRPWRMRLICWPWPLRFANQRCWPTSFLLDCGLNVSGPLVVLISRAGQRGPIEMLKIWGRANYINVQRALWCCGEPRLPYDRIDAGNEFGVTKTPQYRALNPNSLV